MRGPAYRYSYRAGNLPPAPVNENDAWVYTLPPPTGGWNTSSAPANMPATDALVLDNIYPDISNIALRKGYTVWATGITGFVRAFINYQSGSSSKLFAATASGIWDVTSTGAVGSVATSCTDGDWRYSNITTSGGNYLVAVNGVDAAKLYDGTSWAATTITGVTTSDLVNVVPFKNRLWFIEKNSMSAWFLGSDSIGGAASEFPFGPVFGKGGYLVAQFVWSIDGGDGLDDYLVTVTSEGEIAVYAGTDPTDSSLFGLVGTYDVGRPLGNQCFVKYGGDVLYLSTRGIFVLSQLLVSVRGDRKAAVSQKIDNAFKEASALYKNNEGWQALIYPETNALIVNIPTDTEVAYQQFVMNDYSKAWCRFSSWNFHNFVVFNEQLYAGGDGEVSLAWSGSTDDVAPITATVSQAYNQFGRNGQKQPSLVRPVISISGTATILIRIDADFEDMVDSSQFSFNSDGSIAIWDVAEWDVAVWNATSTDIESNWAALPAKPGYMHSFRMQITTSVSVLSWRATYFACRPAGIL